AALQRVDYLAGVVDAERRLREHGDPIGIWNFQALDLGRALDDFDALGRLAARADDLVVRLVPDEHDPVAALGEFPHLAVDLLDERAGRVDHALEAALARLAPYFGRDPVRAEHEPRLRGHFVDGLDEDDAAAGEVLDHVAVVDDLVKDVERRAVFLKRA